MAVKRDFLGPLFHRGSDITDFLTFNRAKAVKWQEKTLKKMLFKARMTEFGEKYEFEKILISHNPVEAFCQHVPISNYSLMHEWWQREYNGESNIT